MKCTKFSFTFPETVTPFEIAQLAGRAESFLAVFPLGSRVILSEPVEAFPVGFIVEVFDDQEGRPKALFNALVTYIASIRGIPLSAGEITRPGSVEESTRRLEQSEKLDEAIYLLDQARETSWGEASDQIGAAISILKLIQEVKA